MDVKWSHCPFFSSYVVTVICRMVSSTAVSYTHLLAIMRSHGGRVRAVESGEVHIDIAFIGAPTCDEYGNMRANGGKSDCGVLS